MKKIISFVMALLTLVSVVAMSGCGVGENTKWEDIKSEKVSHDEWINAFDYLGALVYSDSGRRQNPKSVSAKAYCYEVDSQKEEIWDVKLALVDGTGEFGVKDYKYSVEYTEDGETYNFGRGKVTDCEKNGSNYMLMVLCRLGSQNTSFSNLCELCYIYKWDIDSAVYMEKENAYFIQKDVYKFKIKFKDGKIVALQTQAGTKKGIIVLNIVFYNYDNTSVK